MWQGMYRGEETPCRIRLSELRKEVIKQEKLCHQEESTRERLPRLTPEELRKFKSMTIATKAKNIKQASKHTATLSIEDTRHTDTLKNIKDKQIESTREKLPRRSFTVTSDNIKNSHTYG